MDCKHVAYAMREGELVCAGCGQPSPSLKWRQNVFGKAVPQAQVENKGLSYPPESRRISGRGGRRP